MGRNVVFNGSTMLRKWASSSPHTHHTLHLTHSIPIFSALGSTHHTHPHIWLLSIYVQCVHCAMCIGYHLILHQVQSLQTWNAHFFVCFLPQLVVFFLFNTTYQHCSATSLTSCGRSRAGNFLPGPGRRSPAVNSTHIKIASSPHLLNHHHHNFQCHFLHGRWSKFPVTESPLHNVYIVQSCTPVSKIPPMWDTGVYFVAQVGYTGV